MSISPQPALRARRRSNPVAQYLLALAVTITAYVAYAVFAIPALEGTPAEIQRPRRTTVTSKPTQRDKTWLRAFVPADGWEWQSCKTLTVAGGTILFRDYQPLDGGYAEVFPLTLVMNAKPPRADGVAVPIDPNKTPVIVRCPERVQLKFDRPMSEGFTDGKLQLESARLVGPVTIYRPESQPGADDGLSVLTRNLQIDRTKLFTLEDVKFAYGPHLGHGRHLTVELERSSESGTQSTLNAGFGDISGVRQIKLASLSKLRLEPKRPKSGGTRQTLAQSKAEPRGDLFSDQGAPIEISCRGPFQFDLQQRVAILNDQVAVDQIGTTTESLRCDGLRLAFSPDASEHLQPVRVEAWGNAARVVSASRETAITAQHFTYDVVTGRFQATADQQVTIVNPDLQLATRKIDCTITPGRPLGSVEAVGPGKLIRNTRDQDSGMQVSWQQRLRVRKEDGLQRVQIEGAAEIQLADDTRVTSDQLDLWLAQMPGAATTNSPRKDTWQPKRLVCDRNVRLESPSLSGATDSLEASWQVAVLDEQPYRGAEIAKNQQPSKSRLEFTGRKVQASLRSVGQRSELMDLSINGDVKVEQLARGNATTPAASIEGQQLKLTPQPNDLFRVHVVATAEQPAKFQSRGIQLEGQQVFLDQATNRLWVEGAGRLSMTPPQKPLNSTTGNRESRSSKPRPRQLDLAWLGGMIFDGQKIYFENEVAMTAELTSRKQPDQTTRARSFSQGLSMTMKVPIGFDNLSDEKNTPDPELKQLVLVERVPADQRMFQLAGGQATAAGNVRLASVTNEPRPTRTPVVIENVTFDANGKRVEQQTVIAPEATFDAQSGIVQAKGPGAIQVHRFGKAGSLAKPFGGTTTSAASRNRLMLTHVKFDGSLIANSAAKEMEIDGRVRSLVSPVASFDEMFDPDRDTTTWPLDAVKLICERATLAQWNPQSSAKPSNEIMATGNAHIVSSRFEATADRVSYSQANDMLVVEGTPRSDANLWFRQTPTARPNHLVAGKILYRLSDQWTEVQNVRNVKIKSK